MSDYYDDRPRRAHRTMEREPQYVREETYIERGKGASTRDLVHRPRREDSIEDIPRDFPPPRHAHHSRRQYDDDYYGPRSSRGDYYDRDGYYSDEYERRPRRERRKSIVDNLKEIGEAAGLGGVISAVTGRSRSRSRHRHDRGYDSDRYDRRSRRYSSGSRSPGGHRKTEKKWEQAATAALVAGAVEAFRSRKTPGPWTGEKGQRVATAALGAAGIDGLIDKDPDRHKKRHVAGSALGGLVANRLANGSRSRSRGRRGSRSPSRSRSRSRSLFGRSRSRGRSSSRDSGGKSHTLRNVAGTGAVLAAGKALYDRVRSKSRSRRERSRSRSVSSEDSYVPSRSRRSRGARSMDDGYSEAPSRANSDRRVAIAAGAAGPLASQRGGGRDSDRERGDVRPDHDVSDSDSTTDLEIQRKKMKGRELITAGLATVATIHAAHGVYSSIVASEKRRRMVKEGDMSPEESRKLKYKNILQDAAAVGIAALGIKSAYSEWKEMNDHRRNVHELEARRRKRRKAREKREREARMGMPGGGMAPIPYQTGMYYPDGNPYGAGVPPPPMGAPGMRY
ncbi:uncharacterized protein EI97DRAFT_458667 [Westerdykella ornata]|uniref:DUF3824 domain-containing protein n=1 Tax=Westerdykella ornata TaxID=318751 RepID=A0A6A6JIW5_WESOR|nr:uncharacterized protein EI97DRAFT_458667 [Westerdykella ornata]KAF2276174.1 hypothetical protein EI97DRAFT_458667 [Westerdykella ornata]